MGKHHHLQPMTMEPTPEQISAFLDKIPNGTGLIASCKLVARIAYAAGADAELESFCEWIVRRPKPPSLKQRAVDLMASHEDGWIPTPSQWNIIRRAIDSLPDD